MIIDTHSHLNFKAFKDDYDEVVARSLKEGVFMINVGSNFENSKKAVEMAGKYPHGVYSAIGLHPMNLETALVKFKGDELEGKFFEGEFDYLKYKNLAQSSKKVVAIGEIGLDYYYRPKTSKKKELFKEEQKAVFLKQLDLASELNLPVIIHCRMAHEDIIDILKSKVSAKNFKIRGVIHCYTGNWEQTEKYLEMGFYLGFNGLIFKMDQDEVIKKIPLEKILIETDCPYLSPPDFKDQRNEPVYIKYVADKISKIKNKSLEEISEATSENAKKLFKL